MRQISHVNENLSLAKTPPDPVAVSKLFEDA
jgi:hypothetical protein